MGIKQDLYDRTVDHAVSSRQYEERVQVDSKRVIRRHRRRLSDLSAEGTKDLSQAGRTRLITKIAQEIKRFTAELEGIVGNRINDFGLAEIDFSSNNLQKSLGRYARIKRPRASIILQEIVGANIRGEGTLSRRIQSLGAAELTRIQIKIKNGVKNGLTPSQIQRDIVRSTRLTEAQTSALVRKALTRTQ